MQLSEEQRQIIEEKIRFSTNDAGVFIITDIGPLFWTTSKTIDEAFNKLILRIEKEEVFI